MKNNLTTGEMARKLQYEMVCPPKAKECPPERFLKPGAFYYCDKCWLLNATPEEIRSAYEKEVLVVGGFRP